MNMKVEGGLNNRENMQLYNSSAGFVWFYFLSVFMQQGIFKLITFLVQIWSLSGYSHVGFDFSLYQKTTTRNGLACDIIDTSATHAGFVHDIMDTEYN